MDALDRANTYLLVLGACLALRTLRYGGFTRLFFSSRD